MSKRIQHKTIIVDEVRSMANNLLANPKLSDDERKGVRILLERVLFQTENYRGYNHLEWLNGGFERWLEAGQPEDDTKNEFIGNDTMRIYF